MAILNKIRSNGETTYYWNLYNILPYQRAFNFINGPRSIGKTYTTLKWLIKQFITKQRQFAYICRTQDEKKNGVLKYALEKVLNCEYPKVDVVFDTFKGDILDEEGNHQTMCFCIALSEYIKIKKYSFPNVTYILFDEYMLEGDSSVRYVNGWKEPELFINIYQTIDRDQDKVKCFLLGNNTSFYNPYHLSPMFNIPYIQPNETWMNKTCLFQWAMPSKELKEYQNKLQLHKTVKGSKYSKAMMEGAYTDDNIQFIAKLTGNYKCIATLVYNQEFFGVFRGEGKIIISSKTDPTIPRVQALTKNDLVENSTYLPPTRNYLLTLISEYFKFGRLYYENMEVKSKILEGILCIVR